MKRLILISLAVLAAGHGGGHFSGLRLSAAYASGEPQAQNRAPTEGLNQSVLEALKRRDGKAIEQLGPTAYDALIAALRHVNDRVRSDAVYYLGRLRDPRSIEPLVALREDPSPSVRGSLASALKEFADPRALRTLMALREDPSPMVRTSVASTLAKLTDPQAIGALIALLEDTDGSVRSSAASAVSQVRGPQALEPLVTLLKHPDYSVRNSAVTALGRLGDQRAVEPLIAAMSDTHYIVRSQAADSLRSLGWEPATDRLRAIQLVALRQFEEAAKLGAVSVAPLLSVLKGMDGKARRGAAEALAKIPWQPEDDFQRAYYLAALGHWPEVAKLGPVAAVEPLLLAGANPTIQSLGVPAIPPLCAALKSPNREVRRRALGMLGKFPSDSRVVDSLIQALKDEDAMTRSIAAGALGKSGDPRAVAPLIEALKDSDTFMRHRAAIALGELGDPRGIGLLIEALKDRDPDVKWGAGFALKQLSSKGATEQLVARLADKDARTRALAAEALANMRDARAIEPAIAVLNDPNPEVRLVAVGTLGSLRDPRAVQPLIGRLQDPDPTVRSRAANGLASQRDAAAVEPLISALKEQEDGASRDVASALGQLGDKRAIEPLRARLTNKDGSQNSEVAYALAQLKDASAVEPLIAALMKPDSEWTGMFVVGSLMQMGAAAMEPLISRLKDGDPKVRCLAAQMLSEIPDRRLVEPLIGVLQDSEPEVVQSAARGLVFLDDPRAAGSLVALLQDPKSPSVKPKHAPGQTQATTAARATKTNSIKVATLLRRLDDSSQPARQEIAAWLSGRLGAKQACDHLFALLAKPTSDSFVVAQALVRLRDPRGIDPLMQAVREAATEMDRPSLEKSMAAPAPVSAAKPGVTPTPLGAANMPTAVKQGAEAAAESLQPPRSKTLEHLDWTMDRGAEALASLSAPAFEPLLQTLKDQQPRMRVFAANTLGRLSDPRAVGPLTAALKDPDERVRSAAEAAVRQTPSRPDTQRESQQRDASATVPLPKLLDGPEEPEVMVVIEASPPDNEPSADSLKRQCQQNLRELYAGIKVYQKSHRDLPDWLSDLVPEHISKTNIFVCPTQTETITTYPGLEDPRIKTSYTYDFCARAIPNTVWGGSPVTMKDWKNRQRKLYGDAVPMIRCTHHDRVLNVSYGGELFESSVSWENDERFLKLSSGREQGPGQ